MSDYTPALPKVPRIGTLLRIEDATGDRINADARKNGRFFGDEAVIQRVVTQPELNAALIGQAHRITDAALADIAHIKKTGDSLPSLAAMRPQFGHAVKGDATRIDAILAAANAARNLVRMSDGNQALATELEPSVRQATSIIRSIAGGNTPADLGEQVLQLGQGLQRGMDVSGMKPADPQAYIAEMQRQITNGGSVRAPEVTVPSREEQLRDLGHLPAPVVPEQGIDKDMLSPRR